MRDQPISEVDDPITRGILNTKFVFKIPRFIGIKPISSKSIQKYILSIVPLIEDKIKIRLPDKFGIMWDVCIDHNIHYVAIFTTYMNKEKKY